MNKKLLLILLFIFVLGIVGCGAPKKEITSITIDIEYLEIEVGEDGVIPITYDGVGDYSDLVFSISDETIANIDKNYVDKKFDTTKEAIDTIFNILDPKITIHIPDSSITIGNNSIFKLRFLFVLFFISSSSLIYIFIVSLLFKNDKIVYKTLSIF